MTIDEAISIVRDEAAYCRRSGEQCVSMTDRNDGYGDFLLRKAKAQETVLAEVARLAAENARLREADPILKEAAHLCVAIRNRRDVGGDAQHRMATLGRMLAAAGLLEPRYVYQAAQAAGGGE